MIPTLISTFSVIGLAVFIFAIRVSYKIEAMTNPRKPGQLPVYTNIFKSAFGHDTGQNAGLASLVKSLRFCLIIVAATFVAMALLVSQL